MIGRKKVEFNTYFYDDVNKALEKQKEYQEQMKYICHHMMTISPRNNKWYYNNTGFLQVDVEKKDYDVYIEFMEKIVGCSYCHLMTSTGITLMVNLTTLKKELDKQYEKIKGLE